ncbi:MAG: hypothetical protein HY456_03220 [Parcubacteria group bacterium]|nr:hypothetical protein [Parcubacteria group bacterium]
MADQYPFGQSPFGQGQNQKPQPPEPPPVQPPPPPPITVRTMESDIKSMQESGGTPIPQPVKQEEIRIPGITTIEPTFMPGAAPATRLLPGERGPLPPWAKLAGLIVGAIALIAIFGFVGYYFVYPLVFPPQPSTPSTPTVSPQPPAPTPPAPATSTAPTLSHASFFTIAANQNEALQVTAITAANIHAAMATSALQTLATSSIKEVTFSGSSGLIISSQFLPALLPVFTEDEIKTNMGDDFTSYLYYDDNGVWPGFVFKLKDTAVLFEVQDVIKKIETATTTDFKNLYVSDPQDAAVATFQNGQMKGSATRYLPFQKAGASLNYGLINNYFIISTSYSGIQEATRRLGL